MNKRILTKFYSTEFFGFFLFIYYFFYLFIFFLNYGSRYDQISYIIVKVLLIKIMRKVKYRLGW